MCELLVGLDDVIVLGVEDPGGDGPLVVAVETTTSVATCRGCRSWAALKERVWVEYVDLPVFGRPSRLRWRKRRWRCPDRTCGVGSWTETAPDIAASRQVMTTRAGRWATVQVGRSGRTVNEVATELGCDWHTVNDTVAAWGDALLAADTGRIEATEAVGLDETLFNRRGRFRTQAWCTSITDICGGRLLDIVPGRDGAAPASWLTARGERWLAGVKWATLDLSGAYRSCLDTALPDATQVADPFHVVKLANQKLDECRRRVQNQTLGHRGRKLDPLYRARKLLVMADERLDQDGHQRLRGLLRAGDPHGEVYDAWIAKECVRDIYTHHDPDTALEWVTRLGEDLQDERPPEVRSLGRTIVRWARQIVAWHASGITNAATEAANNLIKRIKRVGFGFRSFRNYRIRVLLYAGRPNWTLLERIYPAHIR
jgi:transposase